MLSIMIDAREEHDVATVDVVAAYLKAFMHDFVVMNNFHGESVDMLILCRMNPNDTKHIVTECGCKLLYVNKRVKALYSCVKLALLCWYQQLFRETLHQAMVSPSIPSTTRAWPTAESRMKGNAS